MPTSTPAFQMAAMYGVRPDIPGFHYHDKRRRADVYFPRAGDAALVERTQSGGRLGIVAGGSTYGCVFTGGATNNLFSFAMLKRPTPRGILAAVSAFVVMAWVLVKCLTLTAVELVRFLARALANPLAARPHVPLEREIPFGELFGRERSRHANQLEVDTLTAFFAGDWFLGERYSALDPYAFVMCRWTRGFQRPARSLPHLKPFLDRMLARPAVQRALATEKLPAPYV